MSKPCDDLRGTCEEYPACACGRAWREIEGKLRASAASPKAKKPPPPAPPPKRVISEYPPLLDRSHAIAPNPPRYLSPEELEQVRKVVRDEIAQWAATIPLFDGHLEKKR